MEHKRKTETLVNRLRRPLTHHCTEDQVRDKWNAIGEALAYLVDKKHAKIRRKKMSKKTPLK